MEHVIHVQFKIVQTAQQPIQASVLPVSITMHLMVMAHAHTVVFALLIVHHVPLTKSVNLVMQDIL